MNIKVYANKNDNKLILGLFVFIMKTIIILPAVPETKTFDRITIFDGLSQSSIHSIFNDKLGFMWFGTYDGLNVYDGYDFYIFRNIVGDPKSISDNNIYPIYEDSKGIFWVGTEKGLNILNREDNSFTHFFHDPADNKSLSHDAVYSILEDSKGTLWIGTGRGINIYDRKEKTFTNYDNRTNKGEHLCDKKINVILEDAYQQLWIGTDVGLFKKDSNSFLKYVHDPEDKGSISDNIVLSAYEDNAGNLWIGTGKGGLNQYIRDKNTFICYKSDPDDPDSLSDNQVRSIGNDFADNLWIATNEGLNLFQKEKKTFLRYKNDPNDVKSINNNLIRCLYKDHSGILWIGTLNGITTINPEYKKIITYMNKPENLNSISHNYIRSIHEDSRNKIWIGTRGGGLNKYDPLTKSFKHYKHNPADIYCISGNNITGICEDDSGNLWVGTTDKGLNKLVRGKDSFVHYNGNNKENSVSSNEISVIAKDSRGTIWVGTSNEGMNRYDPDKNIFHHYKHNSKNNSSISDNNITVIFEDGLKHLWIGTNNGLNEFDDDKFIIYRQCSDDPFSLTDNSISSMTEDADGNLWIGTVKGLNKFDRKTRKFKRYTMKEGLVNECIYGILTDKNGYIWFSTNFGISKLNPQNGILKHYDVNDGLQSNEFNSGASLKTRNGEMFFGGVNGLNSFFPEEMRDNPKIPPLAITSINCGGKKTEHNLKEIREINLDWKYNFFETEFSSLNFIGTKKNQYEYFLEGFDKQWNYSKSRRFLNYTNLPGGKFTLRIRSSNNDNIWNKGIFIKVKVATPPWKRWWAYCLYLIIPAAIFFIVIRYFLESQKHGILKRFTINIAHEMKTPLTLISNYLERYIKNHEYDNDLGIVQKNIDKLKNDMTNFFNTEAIKIGKILYDHEQTICITKIIENKLLIFRETFATNGVTMEKDITAHDLFIKMDPVALDKILNNLLENAMKYNRSSGSVMIKLFEDKDRVILTIRDTGIGISRKNLKNIFKPYFQVTQKKKNNRGVGLGLYITRKIIEEANGKITVESELNEGSVFKIILPKQQMNDLNLVKYQTAVQPLPDNNMKSPPVMNADLIRMSYDENKYSVMVVEDNKDLLSYLHNELTDEYNVFYGLNGEDALNYLETVPRPDVIISDIMMDTMDGYEFYDRLKKDRKYHSVPFIFLTAKTGIENRLAGLQKGAVDFIEKPFSIELVKLKISSLIDLQISKELDVLENISQYRKDKMAGLFKKYGIMPSEQQVVIRALQGDDNNEISSRLNVSYNTVKTYFYRIYQKCGVNNRVELINLFGND